MYYCYYVNMSSIVQINSYSNKCLIKYRVHLKFLGAMQEWDPHMKKKKCMSTDNFWGTAHLHVGGKSVDARQGSGIF